MKIDRLIGIITILLQNEKATAPYLARRFEVSRRTILRDVDTLCQAGIPIATTRGGDGGISIMEGYKLDRSVLTTEELQAILTGLRSIDSVSKNSSMENLLLKLAPRHNAMVSLPDSIVIDLSSHYRDSLSEKIGLIKKAIVEHKLITFDYYYGKGEARREIEPYFIAFKWAAWYVFGWCTEREDFRMFKLNRLWDLRLTDMNYAPRAIPPQRADLDQSLPDPYHVTVLFDRAVRFRLIEDYGLNCYSETDSGLLLELDYTHREHIVNWILSFGDKAEVLAPPDVRDEVAGVARNLAERYH